MPTFKPDFKEGFVVKGSDSAEFFAGNTFPNGTYSKRI